MRNLDETTITQAVLAQHSGATDVRLREIMTSLVQHLHAFARDVKLSEAEWQRGVEFLGEAGTVGGTDRQELRLLSQVLGLSTLVLAQNQGKKTGCTEAVEFYQAPAHQPVVHDLGADISANALGPRGYISGTVRNPQGQPVPYATLEVGIAGTDSIAADRYALLQSDERGHYHFSMRLPVSRRLPSDSPVGHMLAALDRQGQCPAHLRFSISAVGYQRLTTQIFREGDPDIDADPLFGVRRSLITEWQRHPAGTTPAGTHSSEHFHTLAFDFVLAKALGV